MSLLAAVSPGYAQDEPQPPISAQRGVPAPAQWVINLRASQLSVFAEQVSNITGRTLILDPSVHGLVTVISAEPLDADDVWALFQSVLRVNGFAALKSGSAWRIVPQNLINEGGAPLEQSDGSAPQDLITRLILLHNLPSDNAARVLRPLVASFGYLEALPQPNAIAVTDNAENVRRIADLARLLDQGDGSEVETIPMLYASARDIAPLIERTLAAQGSANGGDGSRILADDRTNALIVRADPASMIMIRKLIASLDGQSNNNTDTRVFRLRFADAAKVTDVLRGLLGARSGSANPVANALAPGGDSASQLPDLSGTASSSSGQGQPVGSSGGSISGLSAYFQTLNAAAGAQSPTAGSGSSDASSNASGFSAGGLSIQPDASLNVIVARGPPKELAEMQQLIEQIDVRRPQVLIEAAIVEITGDDAENFGIQLGLGAAAPTRGGFGATSFSATGISAAQVLTALGNPAGALIGQDGLSVGLSARNDFSILVQALATSSKANLLSTPSLTTLDNEPAEIIVGQNVPFRTGSYTTAGISTNPFTTIERQDIGITLKVLPRVTEGDVIQLNVGQEVSSIAANVPGAADIVTNKRDIDTTVLADNGQTIVLGGLISNDETGANSKVPVFGDLPLVGGLFRSVQKSRSKQTLFVFLRATILRDRVGVAATAQREYGRVRALDGTPDSDSSLLLEPSVPKLPLDLEGIY